MSASVSARTVAAGMDNHAALPRFVSALPASFVLSPLGTRIANVLLGADCCFRCVLRFLGCRQSVVHEAVVPSVPLPTVISAPEAHPSNTASAAAALDHDEGGAASGPGAAAEADMVQDAVADGQHTAVPGARVTHAHGASADSPVLQGPRGLAAHPISPRPLPEGAVPHLQPAVIADSKKSGFTKCVLAALGCCRSTTPASPPTSSAASRGSRTCLRIRPSLSLVGCRRSSPSATGRSLCCSSRASSQCIAGTIDSDTHTRMLTLAPRSMDAEADPRDTRESRRSGDAASDPVQGPPQPDATPASQADAPRPPKLPAPVEVKEIFKHLVANAFARESGMSFDVEVMPLEHPPRRAQLCPLNNMPRCVLAVQSPFSVEMHVEHPETFTQFEFLTKIPEAKFTVKTTRRKHHILIRSHKQVPPPPVTTVPEISQIGFLHEQIYIADHKFSSAGREDADVLMLGRGRPFYLELVNPQLTMASEAELAALQRTINDANRNRIAVHDLQLVSKDSTMIMKRSADTKSKSYACLVEFEKPVPHSVLEGIAARGSIPLKQRNPTRVPRRADLVRDKMIEAISFEPRETVGSDDPAGDQLVKVVLVRLKTSAGTYVKEFVHGDGGRTEPSLASLAGPGAAKVIELDVLQIHLDWPEVKQPGVRLLIRLASASTADHLGRAALDLVGRDFCDTLLPVPERAGFLAAITAGGCRPLPDRYLPSVFQSAVLVQRPAQAQSGGRRKPAPSADAVPCLMAFHWIEQFDRLWLVIEIELASAAALLSAPGNAPEALAASSPSGPPSAPAPPPLPDSPPDARPAQLTILQSDPTLGPPPRNSPAPGTPDDTLVFPTIASGFHRSPSQLMAFLARLDSALAAQRPYPRLIAFCCRFLRLFCGFERGSFVRFHNDVVGMVELRDNDPAKVHLFTRSDAGQRMDTDPEDWRHAMLRGSMTRHWQDTAGGSSPLVGDPALADFDTTRMLTSVLSSKDLGEFLLRMSVRSVITINIVSKQKVWGLFALHALQPTPLPFYDFTVIQAIGQLISSHIEAELLQQDSVGSLSLPTSPPSLPSANQNGVCLPILGSANPSSSLSNALAAMAARPTKLNTQIRQPVFLNGDKDSQDFNMTFLIHMMSELAPLFEINAGIISLPSSSKLLLYELGRDRVHYGYGSDIGLLPRHPSETLAIKNSLEGILTFLKIAQFPSLIASHKTNVDLAQGEIVKLLPGYILSGEARQILDAHHDAFEEYPGMLLVPLSNDGQSFMVFLRARKPLGIRLISAPPEDITSICTEWTTYEINLVLLTPLHALINTAEAAMEEAAKRSDPAGLLDKLQTVRDTSVSLVPLMHDLLHLLQSRSGQLVFRREPFSVADAVRRASRMLLASVYTTGDTTLDLSISDDLADVMLIGDASKLRQIVWNQCAAVMPVVHGKTTLHLSVGVEDRTADSLTLVIRASSSETSKRSMEASRRAANETLRATGLSFHVMSQLVAARRGTIWDEPHELRVSMHFEIQPAPRPAALIAPAADAEAAPAVSAAEVQAPAGSSSTGERAESEQASVAPRQTRILVAEDNPVNRQVLCRRLRAHLVSEAHDGSACVSMFAAAVLDGGAGGDACDLILMDVQMPECDGIEATRQIRALEAAHGLARTPIIGVSANVSVADWTRCREAGMDGFVPKPTNFKLIEAMIAEIRRGCIREFPPADNITQSHTAPGWFDPATTTAVFAPPAILQ
nr:putative tRNA pseudouridine synthase Pus10 [Polyrhizophydium stewartii]